MLDVHMRRLMLPVRANAEFVRPRKQIGRRSSVSVIIPCYNYGRYLVECVNSVLNQPGVRVDILIIDDASTDGSDLIARRLGEQDTRIRTICHKTNKRHAATQNEGIAQITGDYIVILSADDLLSPGSLARATSLMEEYPSVGLAYGSTIWFTDDELPAPRKTAKSWIIWHGHDWITQTCKTGENTVGSAGVLMRTSVLRKTSGFRDDLPHSGDLEMWMELAALSDVGFVAGADQGYYRTHACNMHRSFSALDDFSQRLAAFESMFSKRSASLKDSDEMRDSAHRAIAHMALDQAMRDIACRAIARSAFNRVIGAYAHRSVDDESIPVDDYAVFAFRVWPAVTRLRQWRTLHKMTKSESQPSLVPPLIARMAARKLRTRFRVLRRRWVGV
jgi:glycosyltransferase involved in cell wall biosynthesis